MKLMSRYYTKNKLKKKKGSKDINYSTRVSPQTSNFEMVIRFIRSISVSLYSLSKVTSLQS